MLLILTVILFSCSKKETSADITIKENNSAKSSISVHMFSDNKGPNTAFFKPFHADKTVATNSSGTAVFDLNEIVNDKQTTLYFGVFDANDNVLGSTVITVKEGDSKSSTINY